MDQYPRKPSTILTVPSSRRSLSLIDWITFNYCTSHDAATINNALSTHHKANSLPTKGETRHDPGWVRGSRHLVLCEWMDNCSSTDARTCVTLFYNPHFLRGAPQTSKACVTLCRSSVWRRRAAKSALFLKSYSSVLLISNWKEVNNR